MESSFRTGTILVPLIILMQVTCPTNYSPTRNSVWKHNKKIIGKLFTQLHSTLLMLMIFSMAASSP